MDGQNWMTVKQAARHLDLSEMTVRNFADTGVIESIRIPGGPRLLNKTDVQRKAIERQKELSKTGSQIKRP